MTHETQIALFNLLQTIVPPLLTFITGWLIKSPIKPKADQ